MIVEDYIEKIYPTSPIVGLNTDLSQVVLNISKDDEEILVKYFHLRLEILLHTDNENLNKLKSIYERLNKVLINIALLPTYYEVYICICYALKEYNCCQKYIRSLKACMDKLEKVKDDVGSILLLEKIKLNYVNYVNMIKEKTKFNENGSKDSLVKHYLSDDLETSAKELQIRLTMKQGRVSRSTAIKYLKDL
jgi:hypothetical protein